MQKNPSKTRENMRDLYHGIPDPDAVLALSPKELAGKLILILRKSNEPINVPLIAGQIPMAMPPPLNVDGYPEERRNEICEALWDAFEWLEGHGLIEKNDEIPGPDWVRVLSSQAKEMRSEEDFQKLMLWRSVNESMLHPKIAKKAVTHLARGENAEAMAYSMKSVEIAVRDACGFGSEDYGIKLMHKAFGENGPLRDRDANKGEEERLKFLFAGAIGAYKNPHSHRDVHVEDTAEALAIVMFASQLLRTVDSRKPLK